jgi:superfamily II DNA/RNA helicase
VSTHARRHHGAPHSSASADGATFADLGVPDALVQALAKREVVSPFPIQAATLPDALAGRDVLGRGQTGSGKTLAFGLPLLARLTGKRAQRNRPLGLVLVPTRELAMQVNDSLAPLAHAVGLDVRLVVGGMPYSRQIEALRRGVPVLVATPGRLTDLVEQGHADLRDVEIAVLDEADHMADMGFLPAVTRLLDLVAPHGQRLLFSATLDNGVDTLVRRYLQDPVRHSTQEATASVTTMDHHLLLVRPHDKNAVATQIAAREGRTIMFVRTKHGADRLARQLSQAGVAAGALHGGKTQAARTRTLDSFKAGRTPVLVATDVAARGIHVDGIDLVVHVDPPADAKDYLHRAGRTARAGESGTVVTLVLPQQQREVTGMAAKAGVSATVTKVGPGDPELATITGARLPSGVPVPEETFEAPRPQRSQGGHRSPRHGAPAGAGRPGRPANGGKPRTEGGQSRPRRQPTASTRTSSKASRASGAPSR